MIETVVCDKTINPNCKSKEELIKKYPSFYMQFLINDIYIKSNDFKTPIINYINSRLIYLSSSIFRTDIYNFQLIDYISDSGIMLEDLTTIKSYRVKNIEQNLISDPTNPIINRILLTSTNIGQVINRNYISIQKVAADVGGILKVAILILGFLSKKYGYFHFYVSLFNKINHRIRQNKIKKFLVM